ncbi:MAG: DUF2130 domain-containing protein [Muribaculaceae bacterium]|nr:DUF2130 domain-containing protein [Muribaculaceae bacterium]
MKEISCPNCHKTFQVDESSYAAIIQQVRSKEFKEELDRREAEMREQFLSKEETVRLQAEKTAEERLARQSAEMARMQNELTRLQGRIEAFEAEKKSALSDLENKTARKQFEILSEKERRISELEAKISTREREHEIELINERNAGRTMMQQKEQKIVELEAEIKADRLAATNRENQLCEAHRQQLRDKQDEIDRLKDFKLRLSTKMVGETLEQHCAILFEQARSMGLYPEAIFLKDNVALEHTKGDFIFRDFIDGTEYVSVMFEMKNEMDATASKHRNDDFLEKLDKDRTKKGCEYAVLVSMLEQDSELYNAGIVDKSYRYPKMLVIRPQFFLPVLRLISEGARKGFIERRSLIRELEDARSQSMDFARFEDKINRFRTSFNKNVRDAHTKFTAAIEGIDKSIAGLEKQISDLRKIKSNFEAAEQKLLKANEIADEDLTVKKLTWGNPRIKKMIEDAAAAEGNGSGE